MRPDWWEEREAAIRQFFNLPREAVLGDAAVSPRLTATQSENLKRFNLEWHFIPASEAVPFDEEYIHRLYPLRPGKFNEVGQWHETCSQALGEGHKRHQGRVVAVETTLKPRYLPQNRQYYGTPYGFDQSKDPFLGYLARAGLLSNTRFGHNYASLRQFLNVVNDDWRARAWLPPGYRLTICPPAVFNLVGTIFHQEWSQTETLELGFYRDPHGSAHCFAVGSNGPGDFSYISPIEFESEWTLLGFRTALVSP
jgi:hypothetical protein